MKNPHFASYKLNKNNILISNYAMNICPSDLKKGFSNKCNEEVFNLLEDSCFNTTTKKRRKKWGSNKKYHLKGSIHIKR